LLEELLRLQYNCYKIRGDFTCEVVEKLAEMKIE